MTGKTPYTLKEDIEHVLRTGEGYTKEIAEWVGELVAESLVGQLVGNTRGGKRTIRVSNMGTPCERKLWYTVNRTHEPEPLPASTLNKFIYGDLTEAHVLGLAKASGHDVAGLQSELDVCGIKGHRDCVIDGMLFDIKSASTGSFGKFSDNGLRGNDPFGYISQLSSYLYGSQHDPIVTYKRHAGFLAMDKQHGHIAVDIYDLHEEVLKKEQEVVQKKVLVKATNPPPRPYEPVDQYSRKPNGNMKLPFQCSYCDDKVECWKDVGLRKFISSNGPVWLTKVVKEPRMQEDIGETTVGQS